MRNFLLILALQTSAACATLHLPPPELAPGSGGPDVGATVSDWYAHAALAEPFDPNRPKFYSGKVNGNWQVGSLTVVTPGDITLGTSSDINLGNASTSALRGGSGLLRLDDAVGSQISYLTTTLLLDGANITITPIGDLLLNDNSGVAGSGTGYTTNATGAIEHRVHKITVARTALTAAATTEDETIWTVPAKTRLMRIIVDVTAAFDDAAGPISAVTIMCGTAGGSTVYVATSSVFTINTIGDVAAEIGANLTAATVADIPSFSATQAIVCRFTSTGGNLSTLTTGSATFYIEHLVYP